MKQLILQTLIIALAIITLNAQTPQAFKYQAVARGTSGQPLTNQTISLRISILQTSASGTIVYSETHLASTNDFGLFMLNIGNGTVVTGDFTTIDWGAYSYFLKVEMDITGGTGYTTMGTTQLLSVPYALYAESANTIANDQVDDADADPTNEIQTLSCVGTQLTISGGNTVTLTDNVNDADADASNELQTLSVSGSNLTISSGNTVALPSGGSSVWSLNGSDAYYNAGNVGIGTTSPGSILTVEETLSSSNNIAAYFDITGGSTSGYTYAGLSTVVDGTNGNNIGIEGSSSGTSSGNNYGIAGFADYANNNIGVYGQSSAANTSTNGFNLGILGLASGSEFSNIAVEAGASSGSTSTGDNYGISCYASSTTGGSNYGIYSTASNGATNYAGYFDGDVTVTGTFTNPSDKKLKTDIRSFNGALNIINNMNPVTYYYDKANTVMNLPANKQYGLIAQELEILLPELVTKQVMSPASSRNENKDKGLIEHYEYKGINYIGLIPVLIQGIKEQQQMIEDQNKRIEELEKLLEK